MPRIDPPGELILDAHREGNFRKFKSRWRSFYVLARLSDEDEDYQRALLLYTMGAEAANVVESSEQYGVDQSCDTILTVLEQFCVGEKNVIHERYKFNSRSQLPGETFDAFYSELRLLANRCGFNYRPRETDGPLPSDEMIRDRIVLGIRDDSVRKKLISQGNGLTLGAAVRVCRSQEITSTAMRSMASAPGEKLIAPVGRSKPTQKYKANSRTTLTRTSTAKPGEVQQRPGTCGRCGKTAHSKQQCPARDAECRTCKKKGHYAMLCRGTKVNEVQKNGTDDFIFTGELQIGSVEGWKATVEVNGHDTHFKLDTGADGTVVSSSEPWLKGVKLAKPKMTLRGPGGHQLEVIGTFQATMRYQDRAHEEMVYVIKNQHSSLLSRDACNALRLVTCNVAENVVSQDVSQDFPKLFSGLGLLKGYTYHISLKPEAIPTCIYTPRNIPHPLREKAQKQLQEMVTLGVISPVTEATEWCSGLVTVAKPSGAVRI